MEPIVTVAGTAAPLPQPNLDTDVIMPKRFLKVIDRAGLAAGAFADLRFDAEGAERPEFVLNRAPWRGAPILVVGDNFGCGSSREHAVWGLAQLGVRVLLGTGFAGIFFDNCRRNGVLAVRLPSEVRDALLARAADPATVRLEIDLPAQQIRGEGVSYGFEIEAARKRDLLEGADAIASTLASAGAIRAWEAEARAVQPWRVMTVR